VLDLSGVLASSVRIENGLRERPYAH